MDGRSGPRALKKKSCGPEGDVFCIRAAITEDWIFQMQLHLAADAVTDQCAPCLRRLLETSFSTCKRPKVSGNFSALMLAVFNDCVDVLLWFWEHFMLTYLLLLLLVAGALKQRTRLNLQSIFSLVK